MEKIVSKEQVAMLFHIHVLNRKERTRSQAIRRVGRVSWHKEMHGIVSRNRQGGCRKAQRWL